MGLTSADLTLNRVVSLTGDTSLIGFGSIPLRYRIDSVGSDRIIVTLMEAFLELIRKKIEQ
jgi:hypothetical protein